jgi:hypothetical protein
VDQCPLRFGHRAFYCLKLRGQIDAGPPFLDHTYDAAQMPLGALQPSGDGRVACVDMWL